MRFLSITLVIVVIIAMTVVPVGIGISVQQMSDSDSNSILIEITIENLTSSWAEGFTIMIDHLKSIMVYIVNIVIQVGDSGGGEFSPTGPPYFEVSNLGAPDQVAQDETAKVDATIKNTGGQNDTQNATFALKGEDVSTGPGAVDIVFLVDDSGSMSEETDTVKTELKSFSSELNSEDVDARYAVLTFTDKVQVQQDFTSDVSQTQTTIDQIPAEGSIELNYRAIGTALSSSELDHRPNARTVIIDLTDETTDRDVDTDPTQAELEASIESEEAAYFAVSPNRDFIKSEIPADEDVDRSGFEGGADRSLDKQVLANRTDGGEYFDIHEGDFSEKFREEISAEVVNVSKETGEPVTLDGGESTGVSFDVNTSELPPGEYTVTVSSENDSESTTFTVTEGGSSSRLVADPPRSVFVAS